MEMHYLHYDLSLAAALSGSLFLNTAVIYTILAQGAKSATTATTLMMMMMMKTIIVVRVMEYYS